MPHVGARLVGQRSLHARPSLGLNPVAACGVAGAPGGGDLDRSCQYLRRAARITWTTELAVAFAYNAVVGVALGYWAMAVVNSRVPATTTSLGLLATPVVGMALSAVVLGERIDTSLVASATMILLGIAIGTVSIRRTVQAVEPVSAEPVANVYQLRGRGRSAAPSRFSKDRRSH